MHEQGNSFINGTIRIKDTGQEKLKNITHNDELLLSKTEEATDKEYFL